MVHAHGPASLQSNRGCEDAGANTAASNKGARAIVVCNPGMDGDVSFNTA